MKTLQRFVAFILTAALLSNSAFAATYVVDRADNNTLSNGCINGTDDDCSLYGAIGVANGSGTTDTIVFDDGTVSPDLIAITTVSIDVNLLPAITATNLTINGDFYTGNNTPDVTIDGSSFGAAGANLFSVGASGVTIKGLNIYTWGGTGIALAAANGIAEYNRVGVDATDTVGVTALTSGVAVSGADAIVRNNTISGVASGGMGTGNGIRVDGDAGASGVTINDNTIGTNTAGTVAVANASAGIAIVGATSGTNSIYDNVISGNTGPGVKFPATGTLAGTYSIYGNMIGTNAAGTAALANSYGIQAVTNASSVLDVTIGGDAVAERNVISGNTNEGINIADGTAVTVSANYIGTAADGTTQLANGADGIEVNATTVTIGTNNDGTNDSAERNVISGNSGNGVYVNGVDATTVTVRGNYIGVDANGAVGTNMRNTGSGVVVNASGANTVTIGAVGTTATADAANVIGNNGGGIDIQNTAAAATVTVQNNTIGLDVTEQNNAGNTYAGGTGVGVQVALSSGTANVTIGSDATPLSTEGNTISNNVTGISLGAGVITGTIKGNVIGLKSDGTSFNNAAGNSGVGVYVSNSDANLTTLTIGGSTDAESNWIGSNGSHGIHIADAGTTPANVTIVKNILGWSQTGDTARGNTGRGILIADGATVTLTDNNVANSGSNGIELTGGVTLAITANTIGQTQTGTAAGPNTGSALILNAASITSAVIGGSVAGDSNVFAASNGASSAGVYIQNLAANTTAVTLQGNYVGVCAPITTGAIDNTTLATCKNNGAGIRALEGAITLGGDNALNDLGTGAIGEGNVISNNGAEGVKLETGVTSLTAYGNIFGLIRNGAAAVFNVAAGNTASGILIDSAALTTATVGGVGTTTASSKRNVLSSNASSGFELANAAAAATVTVVNNFMGTDWLGATDRGNTLFGIDVEDADTTLGTTTIGGLSANQGNLLSGNGSSGAYFTTGTGDVNVYGNTIGLNLAKSAALANDLDGIRFTAVTPTGKTYNIGSNSDTDGRNYIGGNGGDGLDFGGSNSSALNVYYNIIGLNGDGDTDLGNTGMGINLSNASLTSTIGDAASTGRNVIAGNDSYGIGATGGNVTVRDNYIGVGADGSTSLPNGTYEVYTTDTAGSLSYFRFGGSQNTCNNSTHVCLRMNSDNANYEIWNEINSNLMDDNIWTSWIPNYSFWEKWIGGVLASYGPFYYRTKSVQQQQAEQPVEEQPTEEPVEAPVEEAPAEEPVEAPAEEAPAEEPVEAPAEEAPAAEPATVPEATTPPAEPATVPEAPTPAEPAPTKTQEAVARETVEAALNTTTDVVVSVVTDKERVNPDLLFADVEDSEDSSEEDGGEPVEVVKTEEQAQVEEAFAMVASGETLTREEIKKLEETATKVVTEKVGEALREAAELRPDTGVEADEVAGATELTVKSKGRERKIDEQTEIVFSADQKKTEDVQRDADQKGENKVVVGPSTIIGNSGVSAVLLSAGGGKINDPLASKKAYFKGLSGLASEAKTVEELLPKKPTVTNLKGAEVGDNAVLWLGSNKPGSEVSVFAVEKVDPEDPDTWKVVDLGKYKVERDYTAVAAVDLKKHFGVGAKKLELITQNENGEGSKIEVAYNPVVNVNLEYLHLSDGEIVGAEKAVEEARPGNDSDLFTSVLFASSLVPDEMIDEKKGPGPENRYLNGYAEPGTVIMITWKSLTYNSVVVADASQGYFEVDIPEELEDGDHTVLAYSFNKNNKKASNYSQLFFSKFF